MDLALSLRLLSQLQNPNFCPNPRFCHRIRSCCKLPMASRICQFVTSANLRQNHRICARKRVLQLALLNNFY